MGSIWITTKEAAKLLNKDESVIRKQKNSYNWRYKKGAGKSGKVIEIDLLSLPQKAQAQYWGIEYKDADVMLSCNDCTADQLADINRKMMIIDVYKKSGMNVDEFTKWYSEEHGIKLSMGQLYDWMRKLKKGGTAALIDKRGRYSAGTDTIPPDAWEYFKTLYLTEQKRGIHLCYDLTKKEYPDIPSYITFARKVQKINKYVMTYYREGQKAFNDMLPYMDRDKKAINSNDIWFSDHHLFDVFVNDNGKVSRLWLSIFFDARSSKVISYICRNASGNARIIKDCLCKGIIEYGIPKECYFDNGKDYREKSFNPENDYSIFKQLGINPIYATPYHGQAKTVERFFKTLEERFGKMFPTYTGKDAKQRPECMRKSNKKIIYSAPDTETFLQYLDHYIKDYNTTRSRAEGLEGMSPEDCYNTNLKEKRIVKESDLDALRMLCGTSEVRKVRRNGIRYCERWYSDTALLPYLEQNVRIFHLSDDMDVLSVFTEKMDRFICKAEASIKTPFRNTRPEDFEKVKKMQKEARKLVKQGSPTLELDTMHLLAKLQLEEKEEMEKKLDTSRQKQQPDIPITEYVFPAYKTEVKQSLNGIQAGFEESDEEHDERMRKQDILANYYHNLREQRCGGD